MTSPAPDTGVARLPFKVRPRSGEGAASFITRLAKANHLPPAYLRKYLTEPPLHLGSPTWPRIAAAAGRDPADLRLILNTVECKECGGPIQAKSMFGPKPLTCSRACRQKRYRKRYPTSEWRREPCRICGKLMKMQIGQRRPLCSSACRRTAYLERQQRNQQAAEAPSNPGGDPEPACPICEGPLSPRTAKSQRRTCSQRCRQSAYRWRTTPPHPPVRTPPQPRNPALAFARTCEFCGEPLPPGPGQPRRRTCSARCRQRAHRWRTHPSEEHRTQQTVPASPNPDPPPEPAASPTTVGARADALAPTGNESLETPPCTVCSGPLPEGRSTSQRRTCSQRCRQKAYRQRKAMLL
jgi:predicted nucleic acid-binding Zn ribbon protein